MLGYVLKRFLLVLPAIWIICSLVFLLSKVVPGSFADRQREMASELLPASSIRPAPEPEQIPVPLFYVSLRTSAEPDTLYRLQPASHQRFVRSLVFKYGNWPAIARFYLQLSDLQQAIRHTPAISNAHKEQLLLQVERILTSQEKRVLLASILAEFKDEAIRQQWGEGIILQIDAMQRSFLSIIEQAQPRRTLVPALAWHGLHNQYHIWLKQLGHGNLGVSYRDQRPVNEIIIEAFQNTFFITVMSLCLVFALALELSVWLSKPQHAKWRKPVLALLYGLDSVPLFVMALLLLTLFAGSAYLNIFPVYGLGIDHAADLPDYLAWLYQLPYLVLPVVSLVIVNLPYVTGQIYQSMQQVQRREFILTATAKGLTANRVLRHHVLRNALLPIITLFTGFLPALVSGAIVIEIIYAIPGMGRLLADAVLARDFPVLVGLVLYLGLIKIMAHIVADVLYYIADPRIRLQS